MGWKDTKQVPLSYAFKTHLAQIILSHIQSMQFKISRDWMLVVCVVCFYSAEWNNVLYSKLCMYIFSLKCMCLFKASQHRHAIGSVQNAAPSKSVQFLWPPWPFIVIQLFSVCWLSFVEHGQRKYNTLKRKHFVVHVRVYKTWKRTIFSDH